MGRTPEGEVYLENVRKILGEIEDMKHQLVVLKQAPQGTLRVNTTQVSGSRTSRHWSGNSCAGIRGSTCSCSSPSTRRRSPTMRTTCAFVSVTRRIHAASPASSRNWRIVAASPGYLLRHLCALHRSNPSSTVSPHAVRTASETGTRDVSKRSRQAPR
jgi:hypothetical protein